MMPARAGGTAGWRTATGRRPLEHLPDESPGRGGIERDPTRETFVEDRAGRENRSVRASTSPPSAVPATCTAASDDEARLA